MLKIARYLFCWTGNVTYADYYERAIINGLLGTQRLPASDPSKQQPMQAASQLELQARTGEEEQQQQQQQQMLPQTKPTDVSRYGCMMAIT